MNQAGTGVFFHTDKPFIKPAEGQPSKNIAKTIRIGEPLHIALVVFKPREANTLLPNRPYSYNLALSKQPNREAEEDLNTLQLLQNDPINGKPNLALGYELGFLPSFELPPLELTDFPLGSLPFLLRSPWQYGVYLLSLLPYRELFVVICFVVMKSILGDHFGNDAFPTAQRTAQNICLRK